MSLDIRNPKNRAAELMVKLRKDLKFDPLDELIRMYRTDPDLKVSDRIKICQDLQSYMYPRLKAMELDVKAQQPVVFNFDLSGNINKTQPLTEAD